MQVSPAIDLYHVCIYIYKLYIYIYMYVYCTPNTVVTLAKYDTLSLFSITPSYWHESNTATAAHLPSLLHACCYHLHTFNVPA